MGLNRTEVDPMDNKLNEIRRKIKVLRAQMLSAEDSIRKQLNRDEDCSEAATHLMAMRVVMLGLIGERNRARRRGAAAQCRRAAEAGCPCGQQEAREQGAWPP